MNPNWAELTPEQKLAFRVESFLEPFDITYNNLRAETDYKERADRLYAAIRGPIRVEEADQLGYHS